MFYSKIDYTYSFGYIPAKSIPKPWITAAISAAGLIGSALLSHKAKQTDKQSVDDTNKSNLQISRETNATNLQLAREENAFNLDMWNKNNEYNTPLAQKQRLEEAGINPYLADSMTTGTSDSPITSADLANQQAVQLQPYTGTAQAYNAAFSNMTGLLDVASRLKGIGLDNRAKEMANEVYEKSKPHLEVRAALENDNLIKDTENKQQDTALKDSEITYNNWKSQETQRIAQKLDKELDKFDRRQELELDLLDLQQTLIQSNIDLNKAQKAFQESNKKYMDKQVDNYDEMASSIIKSNNASARYSNTQSDNYEESLNAQQGNISVGFKSLLGGVDFSIPSYVAAKGAKAVAQYVRDLKKYIEENVH